MEGLGMFLVLPILQHIFIGLIVSMETTTQLRRDACEARVGGTLVAIYIEQGFPTCSLFKNFHFCQVTGEKGWE